MKTLWKALLITVSFAIASSAHAAKSFIAGQVIDRNGEPIEKAIVTLDPGNVQLVTDNQGRFLIDYLRDEEGKRIKLGKKKNYLLEIFKPGFHVSSLKIFYKRGDVTMDSVVLNEETLQIKDDLIDLDFVEQPTQASGATYEGQ